MFVIFIRTEGETTEYVGEITVKGGCLREKYESKQNGIICSFVHLPMLLLVLLPPA